MILISAYNRILWFHNRVIGNRYPNARNLSEYFEISARQAQRDIEYLRDSMNAPLVYSAKNRGYFYDRAYALPQYFLSETEKQIRHAMADGYARIGDLGYKKYGAYADILSKIYGNGENTLPSQSKEPYIAELKFLDERTSTVPLDFFVCQRKSRDTALYTFYDPDIFIGVLLSSHLRFQVLHPKWLNEYIKNRLSDILSTI